MNQCPFQPLVSIITVIYNVISAGRKNAFLQCLESVHFQDYPNIEHVIVDGASNDGTLELLKEYEQLGWITYHSSPDKGIYDAMNKGIMLAKGKYVALLNSDDCYHDSKGVSSSVEALERTGATFSYAPRNYDDKDGKFICEESASIGVFAQLIPFSHPTMFTKKEALIKYNMFDSERYKLAADYDLILKMILNGEQPVYVARNFTSFRAGGASNDSLGAQEMEAIRLERLGADVVETMKQGYLDDSAMQSLMSKVHKNVALDMVRCYHAVNPGVFEPIYGLILRDKDGNTYPSYKSSRIGQKLMGTEDKGSNRMNTTIIYRLFNILPVFKRKIKCSREDWYLFSFIPFIRIRHKDNRSSCRLFFVIPILQKRLRFQK